MYCSPLYYMFILLPDENDLDGLMKKLPNISWKTILGSFKRDAEVTLKLPKFDIENKFNLKEAMQAMGVKRAFQGGFDRMFADDGAYAIDKVIQKAKITVAEWGTEAAAVTIVEMQESDVGPGQEPKRINFFADHPFVYLIGEATSGTILFEGVYSGK